jgi:hypothetical protein
MAEWSDLAVAVAGGLVVIAVQRAWSWNRDRRDTRKIIKWLMNEERNGDHSQWRSTRAIASHNNLSEERVTKLCSEEPSIYLSTGANPGMWSVTGRERSRA